MKLREAVLLPSPRFPLMRQTKVFFVCPGLGHVARGFETFTGSASTPSARAIRLDLFLLRGPDSTVTGNARSGACGETGRLTRVLGTMIRRDAYYVEQTTFALALLPQLVRLRPDVIYFSDGVVGNLLWRWRRLSRGRFKLLLS